MRHVCPGATGVFEILNRARLRREGFQDFGAYGMRMGKQWPVTLEGSPMPRIREGALCLNDPAQAREFLAVFRVARTMAAALTS
jgi:hypothetical protein